VRRGFVNLTPRAEAILSGISWSLGAHFIIWLFVNFTVMFLSRPTQIQLLAMKQNPCPVVGEVAKPTALALMSWMALLNPAAQALLILCCLKLSKPVS
jgi:hypothetical protein